MGEFLSGYSKGWWEAAKLNRILVRRYNEVAPTELYEKYLILKELLGQVHEDTLIEPPFYCDEGKKIIIGKQFYANYNLKILDGGGVTFGDRVLLGPNVTITSVGHPLHPDDRWHNGTCPIITAPVIIENDVWIGANAVIQMGVTIGRGAVIGSGSVVTRDIPPMVVAAGVPCKVLREINDNDHYDWDAE